MQDAPPDGGANKPPLGDRTGALFPGIESPSQQSTKTKGNPCVLLPVTGFKDITGCSEARDLQSNLPHSHTKTLAPPIITVKIHGEGRRTKP